MKVEVIEPNTMEVILPEYYSCFQNNNLNLDKFLIKNNK